MMVEQGGDPPAEGEAWAASRRVGKFPVGITRQTRFQQKAVTGRREA